MNIKGKNKKNKKAKKKRIKEGNHSHAFLPKLGMIIKAMK